MNPPAPATSTIASVSTLLSVFTLLPSLRRPWMHSRRQQLRTGATFSYTFCVNDKSFG